ncbi:hypothetical protein [Staphylococcus intermedius]|uniref:hypothetical protein n=1 Tax=Staphylococcus intermedius TaxID=1285 RepID=UPI000BBCBAAC|nr:hypothetical protein [Staphylococcus intermedius]PCF87423.1 hypothetical protein B4W76_03275 [Staphylococcus intermedius]
MNKTFKLYNARKEPMVIVNKKIDGSYRVLGLKGTQLSHVNLTTNHLDEFKNDFKLMHYEELGQIGLEELLDF